MAVTKSEVGTMSEAEEQVKASKDAEVSSAEEGKTPAEASKVSPEAPVYSQKQTDALIQAVKSEAGRQLAEVTKERDGLKSQILAKGNELEDNTKEIENLQAKLEDMSKDDPERFDAVKELKVAREERRQLKVDRTGLESERQTFETDKQEIIKWKRDQLVYKVADEYVTKDGEAVDFDTFMNAADRFTLSEHESLVALADTLGYKLKSEEINPLKPDSGRTRGGSTHFTREQIADRSFWEANKEAILEAQKEGRIRD